MGQVTQAFPHLDLEKQIEQTTDPSDTRPLLLMAGDEGRFGRIGELRACCCPKGMRPIVPKQQVRQYIYGQAQLHHL